jgi:hypothetical protein
LEEKLDLLLSGSVYMRFMAPDPIMEGSLTGRQGESLPKSTAVTTTVSSATVAATSATSTA